MAEIKIGNQEIEVDSNAEQRVRNILSVDNIADYLNKYWTAEKLGKHKDMKKKHGDIIVKTLKTDPKSLFSKLHRTEFGIELGEKHSFANVLQETGLADDLTSDYVKYAMSITTTRPSIGKGEFLFASIYNNIGFADGAGDLVELKSGATIEVKGQYSIIGNGQNRAFKPLTDSVLYSIFKYLKIDDMSPQDLNTDFAQVLKKRIGDNDRALAKVFVALQNLNNEYVPLGEVAVRLYKEKKQFLRVVAAQHLLIYMNSQDIDYLLAHNNKKFAMFKQPNTLEEAYRIIDQFDIYGWKIGEYGVKVNLK